MGDRSGYAIVVLVIFGLVIFAGPLVLSRSLIQTALWGIPLLYLYISFFWLFFIFLIYKISSRITFE